jgi:mannose-1-phosphate guanylyltransferase
MLSSKTVRGAGEQGLARAGCLTWAHGSRPGVRLAKCAILDNTVVKANAWVTSSIVGWSCTVGRWVRMEGVSVLGEDVQVADELYINGGRILPHKAIGACIAEPEIVM